MIKVLLVDDQPSVRQGLKMRLALEPDLTVAGEASNGMEALELTQSLTPDVVVMDVEMPEMDGITATERLREMSPHVTVVMLSIHGDAATRARARAAGAAAFVEKQGAVETLLAEIRRAAQ
jgi:DNA-binding NarL/FixJ family response regulator